MAPASAALRRPAPALQAGTRLPPAWDGGADAAAGAPPVLLRPPADSLLRATLFFVAAEPVLDAARRHVAAHGGRMHMDGGADGFDILHVDQAAPGMGASRSFAREARAPIAAWSAAERAILAPSRLGLSFRVNRLGELRMTLHDARFPAWSPFCGEAGLDRIRRQAPLTVLRLAAADAALRLLPPDGPDERSACRAWRLSAAMEGDGGRVRESVLGADPADALFAAACHVGAATAIGLGDPGLVVLGLEPEGGTADDPAQPPAADQVLQDFLRAAAMAAVHPLGRFAEPRLALAARPAPFAPVAPRNLST